MTDEPTPKRRLTATIDLWCSREDYDRMVAAAKKAGLSLDDWAAAVMVHAVRKPTRPKRRSR